eukprot:TRINITY_DN64779_c0_g1_i1.p1 TRINITY_DN64779_c0_g1~~TRINITY_DN64779_c0_g1_i1.p1  ORF type:complete len:136 (-),score=32.03 TRINITY_DN64779_c0_g1_i1:76-483(-)
MGQVCDKICGRGAGPDEDASALRLHREAAPGVEMAVCSTTLPSAAPRPVPALRLSAASPSTSGTGSRYGPMSKRWRLAVRKLMLVRWVAFSTSAKPSSFTAEQAVGAVEASLAIDEEFEAVMQRMGKQKGQVVHS